MDKDYLGDMVKENFPVHPFADDINPGDFERMMRNYLAMSQAFPYLQAGAQKRLLFHYMESGLDVPRDVEISSVVGAFLVWDETGGWGATREQGVEGLLSILSTQERFHSNLLKHDLRRIFGKDIKPEYSEETRDYLKELHDGLASVDPVTRCAFMVSFEAHAERMIEGLWGYIARKTGVDKDELRYFSTHVGGDDPAEAYHVSMTTDMIANLVPLDDEERFVREFINAYAVHSGWCEQIARGAED